MNYDIFIAMKKFIIINSPFLVLLLAGCVRYDERLGIISNDNIADNGYHIKTERIIENVTGKDGASTIIVVPLGVPSISRAVDDALVKYEADALINARIRHTYWTIPYIYTWQKITITGDAVVFEKE